MFNPDELESYDYLMSPDEEVGDSDNEEVDEDDEPDIEEVLEEAHLDEDEDEDVDIDVEEDDDDVVVGVDGQVEE